MILFISRKLYNDHVSGSVYFIHDTCPPQFTGPLSKHLEILQNQDVISEVTELLYISQLKRTEGLERREELELERREQLERREEKRGNGTSQDTLHF